MLHFVRGNNTIVHFKNVNSLVLLNVNVLKFTFFLPLYLDPGCVRISSAEFSARGHTAILMAITFFKLSA